VNDLSELNKLKVQQFIDAVVNGGRLELINELVATDYVGHVPWAERRVLGPAGVRQLVLVRRTAFPDLYVKIDDQVAEEDRVATRWHAAASPETTADAGESAPRYAGISIIRLLAGKQVDSYTEWSRQGCP
jgi:hypothetical protein